MQTGCCAYREHHGILGVKSCRQVMEGSSVIADSCLIKPCLGLHLMKCLASTQGPKIRINAILPGLLLTEWVNQPSSCVEIQQLIHC